MARLFLLDDNDNDVFVYDTDSGSAIVRAGTRHGSTGDLSTVGGTDFRAIAVAPTKQYLIKASSIEVYNRRWRLLSADGFALNVADAGVAGAISADFGGLCASPTRLYIGARVTAQAVTNHILGLRARRRSPRRRADRHRRDRYPQHDRVQPHDGGDLRPQRHGRARLRAEWDARTDADRAARPPSTCWPAPTTARTCLSTR